MTNTSARMFASGVFSKLSHSEAATRTGQRPIDHWLPLQGFSCC